MARITNKLTDAKLKNAKPREKAYKLSDGAGLYCEVLPAGGKYWRMKYYYAGREKRLSIGVYPQVSIKAARKARDEARNLLDSGVDPSDAKQAKKAAITEGAANSFEVVAREWHAQQVSGWSVTHAEKTLRALERDLFPRIGKQPVAEITPPVLLAALREVEARGAIDTANRLKWMAGQVFRYAVATGRADRDPSADLKGALASPKSEHFAAITEPKDVGQLLQAIDGYQASSTVRNALRLAPLVFVRPGELRQAKWADIDLDAAEWRYTVSKTNTQHIVPLSRQAVEILEDQFQLSGRFEYVFPGARSPKRPMSDNAILVALRSLGYEKERMTGHGFRAMARTLLDEVLGYRVDWIEHQLAHAVKDPNGRAYNRTAHLEGRKEMMQGWADYLDELKKS